MKEIEVKISRNEINYDEAVRFMESKVENIHDNLSKELLWFLNKRVSFFFDPSLNIENIRLV